jgi:hypothetical protein
MAAILIGSITYFVLFVIAAYLIQDYATKDVADSKIKGEYRM